MQMVGPPGGAAKAAFAETPPDDGGRVVAPTPVHIRYVRSFYTSPAMPWVSALVQLVPFTVEAVALGADQSLLFLVADLMSMPTTLMMSIVYFDMRRVTREDGLLAQLGLGTKLITASAARSITCLHEFSFVIIALTILGRPQKISALISGTPVAGSGNGLGFVAGGKVVDRTTVKRTLVGIYGFLGFIVPLLLASRPEVIVAGFEVCALPQSYVQSIKSMMVDRNIHCSYDNVSLGSVLRLKTDDVMAVLHGAKTAFGEDSTDLVAPALISSSSMVVDCYLRTEIEPAKCGKDPRFELYQLLSTRAGPAAGQQMGRSEATLAATYPPAASSSSAPAPAPPSSR